MGNAQILWAVLRHGGARRSNASVIECGVLGWLIWFAEKSGMV